jgi:hypothetical protein
MTCFNHEKYTAKLSFAAREKKNYLMVYQDFIQNVRKVILILFSYGLCSSNELQNYETKKRDQDISIY